MRAPLLLLSLPVVFVLACGGSDTNALPAETASAELVNRNWIDVWPESHDDHLHVYRFTPSMGGGVFQDRTVFEGRFELFTFSEDGRALRFHFPGKRERHETAFRIERVDGPAPFNRRLVLEDDPRGPGVYYGYDEERTASPFEVADLAL
ncbi:MAG: hypothetical protein KC586_09685 [Myxococcales bacterium]|nr:hypothetical protein [Myxococcales bacterium]